jgi:hypothetical protein
MIRKTVKKPFIFIYTETLSLIKRNLSFQVNLPPRCMDYFGSLAIWILSNNCKPESADPLIKINDLESSIIDKTTSEPHAKTTNDGAESPDKIYND